MRRCSDPWKIRPEALRPDRVEAVLSINIIACEPLLNNLCVFPGIFDRKPLKEGVQLVERGINKIWVFQKV